MSVASRRSPPANMAAEESLLGACLLARSAIEAARGVVAPEDFYKPAHAYVWQAILRLNAQGEPCDVQTVGDALVRAGTFDAAGGPSALITLQASAPAVSNAGRYARIVQELSLARQGINAAGEIAETMYAIPEDIGSALAQGEARLRDVRLLQAAAHRRSELIGDGLDGLLEQFEARLETPDAMWGMSTGWAQLDNILSGLPLAEVTLVAARPGMGKTSFCIAYAWHVAHVLGLPVLFASLEMTKAQLLEKLLSQVARVEHEKMKEPHRLSAQDWDKITRAGHEIATAPLHIMDDPRATVLDIAAESALIEAGTGVRVATTVVDYVQKVKPRPGSRDFDRYSIVSQVSEDATLQAKLTGQPWVLGAQVGRGVDQRADKRPVLGDLRESGDLEQDAAVVITLYRDEMYDRDTRDLGVIEMAVPKNRYGRTGTARAAFLGHYGGRIANMAPEPPPPLQDRVASGPRDWAAGDDRPDD